MLRYNPYNSYILAKELLALIKRYRVKNNVLIALSLRKNKLLQLLTNILSKKYCILITILINNEVALDDRVTYRKICVFTIYQFKGSECYLVILFSINSLFFKYFSRDIPNDRCLNKTFMALTYAGKQLIIVYDKSKKLMPFIFIKALYKTAKVINIINNIVKLLLPNSPS